MIMFVTQNSVYLSFTYNAKKFILFEIYEWSLVFQLLVVFFNLKLHVFLGLQDNKLVLWGINDLRISFCSKISVLE